VHIENALVIRVSEISEGSYQSVNVIRNAHACLATTTATRGTVGSATKKKQTAVSCQVLLLVESRFMVVDCNKYMQSAVGCFCAVTLLSAVKAQRVFSA
jgi:lipoprotein NlpI